MKQSQEMRQLFSQIDILAVTVFCLESGIVYIIHNISSIDSEQLFVCL